MDLDTVADARAHIDPRGELPLPARRRLSEVLTDGVGPKAWVFLEAAAARSVRHHWDARLPTDAGPWELLDELVDALHAGSAVSDGAGRLDRLWAELVDLHEGPDFRSTYAGFAAWSAASLALNGRPHVTDGGSELEIEVESWDASFFASLAAAGGAVWEERAISDDGLRRSFWEWYLDEAERISRAG